MAFPDGAFGEALGTLAQVWELVKPGGRLHPTSFFEAGGHLALEGVLVLVILVLLSGKSQRRPKKEKPLSEKEVDELCAEWVPEPMVAKGKAGAFSPVSRLTTPLRNLIKASPKEKTVDRSPGDKHGARARVAGEIRKDCLNVSGCSFLGMDSDQSILRDCEATIEKYGCGSCGPRGFYGTIDVHLDLEETFAAWMGFDQAILYSYDIATPLSTIPAFCKGGDLIVADEGVSYSIRSGIQLSRSEVQYFKHNDMRDLERILQRVEAETAAGRRPLTRRFIVVEGVYANTGDVAPIARILDLKRRYKHRLMIEESFSLGVLGKGGRGVCEHAGRPVTEADIIFASLGNAFASVGGICFGSHATINHQRLAASGYVFSASLPPFLSTAATSAVKVLQRKPELIESVQSNAKLMRDMLHKVEGLEVLGGCDVSPLIHMRLARGNGEEDLKRVVDFALREGVLLAVGSHSFLDSAATEPTLKVTANASLSANAIGYVVGTIGKAVRNV